MSSEWRFINDAVKENLVKKLKAFIFRGAEEKNKLLVFTDNHHVNRWKKVENVVPRTEYPLVPIPPTYNRNFMQDMYKEIDKFLKEYLHERKQTTAGGIVWDTGHPKAPLLHIILFEEGTPTKYETFPQYIDSPRTRFLLPSLSEESSGSTSSETASSTRFTLLRSSLSSLSQTLSSDDSGELPDEDKIPAPVGVSVSDPVSRSSFTDSPRVLSRGGSEELADDDEASAQVLVSVDVLVSVPEGNVPYATEPVDENDGPTF